MMMISVESDHEIIKMRNFDLGHRGAPQLRSRAVIHGICVILRCLSSTHEIHAISDRPP